MSPSEPLHSGDQSISDSLRPSSNRVEVTLPTTTTPPYNQKLIGIISTVSSDVEEFRGIPYGIIPGRWQHSVVRRHLPEDVFDASKNGPRCPQPNEPNNTQTYQSYLPFPSDVADDEFGCLNLFVSRPSRAALAKAGLEGHHGNLPVYVYIHGGAYAFGAGTDPMWDPARLVAKSVALRKPMMTVHINYRLNIFGFAASKDILQAQTGSVKGCNFGLADQRTALEWVSANIASFGGDSGMIALGGQSAGASSAHALLIEQAACRGPPLFQKVIIQSGAVGTLGPQHIDEAELQWNHICKFFGLSEQGHADRMASLAAVSCQRILHAVQVAGYSSFALVEDGLTLRMTNAGEPLISLRTENHLKTPTCNTPVGPAHVDVLIGDTDVEGSVFYDQVSKIQSFEQLDNLLPNSPASRAVINDIMREYGFETGLTTTALQNKVYTFLSDFRFAHPVELARQAFLKLAENGNQTTTASVSSYRIRFGNPFPGPHHCVAQHCVDLIYIYDCFHDELRRCGDSVEALVGGAAISNAALVEQIQSDWIDFIVGSTSNGPRNENNLLTVYESTRKCRVVQADLDLDYIERKKRFEFLRRYPQETAMIANALRI